MADWAKLKVVELKAELKSRDLPQQGLKADLVARLVAADKATETDETKAPSGPDASATETAAHEQGAQLAPVHDVHVTETATGEQEVQLAPGIDAMETAANEQEVQSASVPDAGVTETAPVASTPTDGNVVDKQPTEEASGLKAAVPNEASAIEIGKQSSTEEIASIDAPPTEPIFESEQKPEDPQDLSAPKFDDAIDEASLDMQKRKRRSASPPPNEESISKRLRVDEGRSNLEIAPEVIMAEDTGRPEEKEAMDTADTGDDWATREAGESSAMRGSPAREAPELVYDAVPERTVAPAIHPATSALYIANLMRPLRPAEIQAHLIDLATPRGATLNDDIIVTFYLDQVRTHAFVAFTSLSAASRVRTLLHDSVWPNESNRKALFVDFIPEDKMEEWIDKESGVEGNRGTRWEVTYADGPDGEAEARHEPASASSKATFAPPTGPSGGRDFGRRPPPSITPGSANSIPIGPRSLMNPPTGPRPKRSGPGPRPPPVPFSAGSSTIKRTEAFPVITYQPVPDDLARRRLANMRSYYNPNIHPRDVGREINRYSFQNGDSFVDRGKEIFEGIRPPHREHARRRAGRPGGGYGRRGGRRGGRGGGGGGGGGRGPPPMYPRGDRYVPSGPPRSGRDRYDYH